MKLKEKAQWYADTMVSKSIDPSRRESIMSATAEDYEAGATAMLNAIEDWLDDNLNFWVKIYGDGGVVCDITRDEFLRMMVEGVEL